jgi:hypothetical protein
MQLPSVAFSGHLAFMGGLSPIHYQLIIPARQAESVTNFDPLLIRYWFETNWTTSDMQSGINNLSKNEPTEDCSAPAASQVISVK